jgi:ABC-type lipoprotein export system ATPase subunit
MINKGSEWRKWDLHIHTKGTNKNDQFNSPTIDDFFFTFFKSAYDNQIEAIGITDYFSIDRYRDCLKYVSTIETKIDPTTQNKLFTQEEIKFIKSIFIFPNVELRISPTTKKGKFINLHFLFNPIIIDRIDNEFFNKLSNIDGYLMNYDSICDYAKSLKSDLQTDQIYQYGIDNFNIEFGKIKNLLETNKIIKENSIIAISSKSNDGVSGLKDYYEEFENEGGSLLGTIKSIYKVSKIIFSNAPSDKEYFLGKKTTIDEVISHTGSLKPCLVGCDAHTENDLFCRFTWIKAQPSFEGLKQIIYEPEERVKIQKEMPEAEKLDNLMIEKVTFTSSENRFTPEPIYFNRNLNVIIGGKSSGKSILLYEIAKTLYENQSDSILKYKDSNNNQEKDLYNLEEDDLRFNFIIETFLGTQQSIKRESNQASILPSIKYIPQNHLSNLVDKSKRNSNELKRYIRDLIREIPQYDKIYNDFIEKLKQNDKIRENDISEYFTYKEELVKKKGELQQKGDKGTIKKSIEALEKKITETKKDLTPEQSSEYTSLSLKNSELNKIKNSLINDLEKLNNFSDAVRYTLNELKAKKTLLLDNLELDNIKNDFTTKLKFIDDAILENDNIKKLITKDENENFQIIEENIFSSEFKRINQSIEEVKEKLIPYTNLFENQKLILSYQNTISEEKIKLSDIEQIEKEIENIIKTANERKFRIFEDIRNNRKLYDNLLTDFAPRIEKIKEEDSELKIEGKIHFNFPKYRESVFSISHGNSKSYLKYNIFNEENEALIDYDFENYLNDLKAIFDSIENGTYSTLKDVTKQRAISLTLEQKWFFDNWDITYKNDTIHKMSTGKASLVLLKVMIKLSAVKGPILIDQPEDNLDNRSVTNELIAYLKDKKKERQIILVTHNANIVVNADAENIIVANQRGQSEEDKQGSPYLFDYINGAIEDIEPLSKVKDEKDLLKSLGIREHITQIVEGGRDAFKKREEKYGF